MRVVVVEDEAMVARRVETLTKEVLGKRLTTINIKRTLSEAQEYLFNHPVDVLLLDLNLNGKDGFELLKLAVSGSFHTIIISAYEDKAMEAFEYGVLDFVGKPFTTARLEKAFNRLFDAEKKSSYLTKYLSIRSTGTLKILPVSEILYLKGAGVYVEICMKDGSRELHDKTLEKLTMILPNNFERIHKSYIVNFDEVKEFHAENYNKIECELHSGEHLPVSRSKYKTIKDSFNMNVSG